MSDAPAAAPAPGCELCERPGGVPVYQGPFWRVIRADGPEAADFPAFYRVVLGAHVAELSDLPPAQRAALMDAVCTVELVLRRELQPRKINLAALGNVVPHLHWHVVARFDWDSRFPAPVWAPAQRAVSPPPLQRLALPLQQLDACVAAALAGAAGG